MHYDYTSIKTKSYGRIKKQDCEKKSKFNWKLVIIAVSVNIGIVLLRRLCF